MSSRRDDLFPSGSIGRSQGLFIQRTPSPSPSLTRETLTAHPLLSPVPATASVSAAPTSDAQDTTAPSTRYATYTPRHRTAPTTGTTLQHSVSPQQQPGGSTAANKLQLVNLKASAQEIGLETNSVGWEILERLVAEHDNNSLWTDIWNALTIGKATLLLPIESGGSADITADFVKDHVALCEGPSGDDTHIVTLSGLRGTLVDDTLTLRSSLLPGSKPFEDLLAPSTRVFALASLSPLPPLPPSPLPQSYPVFTLPSHTDALPLPPHGVTKPPLPPRPGQRAPSQTSTSRISSSFASLFGKSPAPTMPASTPSPQNAEHEHAIEVSAYTIDRVIVRKDVSKAINKAVKAEVKQSLLSSGVPSWVIDRVHDFTAGIYPFVRNPDLKQGTAPPSLYVIDPPQETAEELAMQFQSFYVDLEEGLLAGGGSPVTARPREGFLEAELEKARERRSNGKSEQQTRGFLEAVERVVCSLFYDRLYLLPKSDDASHDEALSSRVAALNMLDLGLEHLGVDVGAAGTGVEALLRACGETLSRLENLETRYGLSRLPPIRLKSEAELENQKTPEASHVPNDRAGRPDVEKAAPSHDANPPPIIVSPGSESQIHVESPVGIEGTAFTASKASATPIHLGQEGYVSSSESPGTPAAPPQVSASSRPSSPTPVSGDIILPLMIFAVVKANPSHFVSHLLYTQRFRNQRVGGEESYCLVNLMAVADFLENVDLKALGLGESEKIVMSTADLTPIPVHRAALESQAPPGSPEGVPARLRRGVEQQVDAIAGSANKVILGVVDQGFGVLRALLPGTSTDAHATSSENPNTDQETAPWNAVRPGFGLLRRESGFSIASLAASLPGRDRAKSFASTTGTTAEESGQMMVDVSSRPGSVRSSSMYGSDADSSEGDESQEDDGDDEDQDKDDDRHDTRSIRSFENMMGRAARRRRPRKSLSDRLASMPGLGRLAGPQQPQQLASQSPSRPTSLLPPLRVPTPVTNRIDTPQSSRPGSPVATRIAPPNQHFLEATADDLRLSEVRELLREYKRVVEGLRAMGGFDE
ncbi:hypothetical protein BC826DRAFT_996415 [Russula brevipes]|nr:hypothetical protein BC826DRAFT_996415 [Russula brevipes]